MSADDQHFLDILSGISKEVRTSFTSIADATDKHFEQVAAHLRESLSSASWLPEAARPRPPPRPKVLIKAPATLLARTQDWVSKNRALTAALVAFIGTGAFLLYSRKKSYARKRRARRASNGARKEVVVIAGPPNSPITKSLYLDLERRGFVVYVLVSTEEEARAIPNEARADVRPFSLDISDTHETEQAMERFAHIMSSQHHAFAGASPHQLSFAGLLVVPDLIYPSGPIETIAPELWSDALNAKVLNTVATVQAFLPIICDYKARVLILTPSIVSSLRPPFHGVESAVVGALDGFTTSLRTELATLGIKVCHFKLGTFDCSGVPAGRNSLQGLNRTNMWSQTTRSWYEDNYVRQGQLAAQRGLFSNNGSTSRGAPLRELHNAVFDALTVKRPSATWSVGRGSYTYDVVGRWVPSGVVGWMLGVRRVAVEEATGPALEDSVQVWEKVEHGV